MMVSMNCNNLGINIPRKQIATFAFLSQVFKMSVGVGFSFLGKWEAHLMIVILKTAMNC